MYRTIGKDCDVAIQKKITIKGAMQRDFDDLILASPISKMFGDKSFFSYFSKPKHGIILHKNDCERKLYYMANEKDTQ